MRVPRVPWHPSKFSNGCLAPVLKCPWLPKISFSIRNPWYLVRNSRFWRKSWVNIAYFYPTSSNFFHCPNLAPVLSNPWNRPWYIPRPTTRWEYPSGTKGELGEKTKKFIMHCKHWFSILLSIHTTILINPSVSPLSLKLIRCQSKIMFLLLHLSVCLR